jgi:hypothetical protein
MAEAGICIHESMRQWLLVPGDTPARSQLVEHFDRRLLTAKYIQWLMPGDMSAVHDSLINYR